MAAGKARDDAKVVRGEAFKFEGEHVTEMGRRQNEIGESI